jgi:uracil DNA glycosylase
MLLLNSSLTVVKGKSNSHAYLWINFTDKLIKWLSGVNEKYVFLLMGAYAKNKKTHDSCIDTNKHKINDYYSSSFSIECTQWFFWM